MINQHAYRTKIRFTNFVFIKQLSPQLKKHQKNWHLKNNYLTWSPILQQMDNQNNNVTNLTKKAAAVFGTALAALTGLNTEEVLTTQSDKIESNVIQANGIGKVKPMPVLKLNMDNPDASQFVASHTSHRSHSSHRSHYSHYSHRSGALFS